MTKELVTIEFRYMDNTGYGNKKITVGVFDTLDEAIIEGNKVLEIFENKFKLHVFPKGYSAAKERFSKSGGCFGSANRLITNLAYLQTPFGFYAQIKTLKYGDVEQTISDVLEAIERYKIYKSQEIDD